jgi:hypothetical protein
MGDSGNEKPGQSNKMAPDNDVSTDGGMNRKRGPADCLNWDESDEDEVFTPFTQTPEAVTVEIPKKKVFARKSTAKSSTTKKVSAKKSCAKSSSSGGSSLKDARKRGSRAKGKSLGMLNIVKFGLVMYWVIEKYVV